MSTRKALHSRVLRRELHSSKAGLAIVLAVLAVVALAWARDRAGVASAVVGASHRGQLHELLTVADTALPRAIVKALDDVSR